MADLVPSTDVKENERALQQEQAHEVEQPQRAQSHEPTGSADANAGTAALLMNGANGMNYVDGSRWVAPDGGGQQALRPRAQNARDGLRGDPYSAGCEGSHRRNDELAQREMMFTAFPELAPVKAQTPQWVNSAAALWAQDAAKQQFLNSSAGQRIVNSIDITEVMYDPITAEPNDFLRIAVQQRLSDGYNALLTGRSVHRHILHTIDTFDSFITDTEAVLSAPLRTVARRSNRLMKGRPYRAEWEPRIEQALLNVEARADQASLNSLAAIADAAEADYQEYLAGMSGTADAMVTTNRYTIFVSAGIVGGGLTLLSGGGLLAVGSAGLSTGTTALGVSEAYNLVSSAWDAGQQDSLFDGILGILESTLQTRSMTADMPGFGLEAGIDLSIPLTRAVGNGVNCSFVGAGGVSLAYSDNREWEASMAVDVGFGGELKVPYFELEAAAGGGLGMQAASPSLAAALVSLIAQLNHTIYTVLDNAVPPGVDYLLPRIFFSLSDDKVSRIESMLSPTNEQEEQAQQVNVNDVTEVSSVGGQLNANAQAGDAGTAPKHGGPTGTVSGGGGYTTSRSTMSTDGYSSTQRTTDWSASGELNVEHGSKTAEGNKTSSTTGSISFTSQDISGDLCLDNNGDYEFLTVSISHASQISTDKIDSVAAAVVDELRKHGRWAEQSLPWSKTDIKQGLSSKIERGRSGTLTVTFTKLSGRILHVRGFLTVGSSVAATEDDHAEGHAGGQGVGRRSSARRSLSGDTSTRSQIESSVTIPIFEKMGSNTDAYLKQTYMRNRIGGTYMQSGRMERRSWWERFLTNRRSEVEAIFINTSGEAGLAELRTSDAGVFSLKYLAWLERKESEWHSELLSRRNRNIMGPATEIANLYQDDRVDEARALYLAIPVARRAKVLEMVKGLGIRGLEQAITKTD